MPKTFYIIGNGFDLYHELDTRYQSFAFYLQNKHPTIHDYLIKYYGLPKLNINDPGCLYDPLWSQFEKALANLNFEAVLEDYAHLNYNPESDKWVKDMNGYQIQMQRVVDALTIDLQNAFKKFIESVKFPELGRNKLLTIEQDSWFLNFNYTDTLERYYKVSNKRIIYIHGKALDNKQKIVLGHGISPETFKKKSREKTRKVKNKDGHIIEEIDYSYLYAQGEIINYFLKSHKPTAEIIQEYQPFLCLLKNISKVIILGHSLAEVDHAYFRKIIDHTVYKLGFIRSSYLSKTEWIVSYYRDDERDTRIEILNSLGVNNRKLRMIKMEELKRKLILR